MRTPRTISSRQAVSAIAVLLLAAGLTLAGAPGANADSTASTGDESVAGPTNFAFYTGQTVAQINTLLGATFRLVDIHKTGSTYDVTLVANSGAFAVPGWWWYTNQTSAGVTSLLTTNNARLISAEKNASGTYDVIMVSNTGAAARSWWWYVDSTSAQIATDLTTNNARLVSLDRNPGTSTYTAVMVSNTGADTKTWWWYVGVTTSQISADLTQNSARLVDLDHGDDGTWSAVMVQQTGADNLGWKWYFNASSSFLLNAALQTGYRVFDLQRYTSGASTVFAALMIDDLSAENRRVENIFESGFSAQGLSGANYGYYVKPISGAATLALQDAAQYEPASGIKAVYNLYAERQVQLHNDKLGHTFYYWFDPNDPTNSGVCPLEYAHTDANKITTTLADGLNQMMGVSDNRATEGVDLRYGRANVNSYASGIGMTGTFINQTVGCGTLNGGYVTLTLDDITKLYEGVYTHSLLSTTRAASFFGRMNGGTMSSSGPFADMVLQEATAQGKPGVAAAFIANITYRVKGGSYDMCFLTGPCSPPYDYVRSNAGQLTLPFKRTDGTIRSQPYVYGWWVNNVSIPCQFGVSCAAKVQADNTTSEFDPEIFRALVSQALQNW